MRSARLTNIRVTHPHRRQSSTPASPANHFDSAPASCPGSAASAPSRAASGSPPPRRRRPPAPPTAGSGPDPEPARRSSSARPAKRVALTPRDRRVLALLVEHRVAIAEQIARVEFPNAHRARSRLPKLAEAGYLARWRPYQRPGSAPMIYTVGQRGAVEIAAATDAPMPRSSDTAEKVLRLQHSPKLGHLLGVVEFFTLLHAAAGALPGAALAEWWSEESIAPDCHGIVRPDGFGRWVEHTPHGPAEVEWLYEHDRGTEKIDTLIGELDKYARLMTEHPRIDYPVLIELPNRIREANLHQRLGRRKPRAGRRYVVVATTNTDYIRGAGHNPAGPVWWLAGTDRTRHRLINLPACHNHAGGMTR